MISKSSVNAMPAFNLKQVQKRQAAQAELKESMEFAATQQERLDALRAEDGKPADLIPVDQVIVKVHNPETSTDPNILQSTTEASFLDGTTSVSSFTQTTRKGQYNTILESDYWRVQGDGNSTTFFTSTVTSTPHGGMFNSQYSFEEVTVTSQNGEPAFSRRVGSGMGARIWNGVRTASSAVGGAVGSAISGLSLPSVKVQIGSPKS